MEDNMIAKVLSIDSTISIYQVLFIFFYFSYFSTNSNF
uniref:Uncharacterized protein n=1 Tax=Nelumbo nucifera TaxID=4432 RepID=A0A822ZEJ2_NELNU|nr:TPA_asm: hypothetical protein HUJ06_001213 [Nelumbo nucifera]